MSQSSEWGQPAPHSLCSLMQAQVHAGLELPKVPRSLCCWSCWRPGLLPGAPSCLCPLVPRCLCAQQPRVQWIRDCRSRDWQLRPLLSPHPPVPAESCPHMFWPCPSIPRADAPCRPAALAQPSASGGPGVCLSPELLPEPLAADYRAHILSLPSSSPGQCSRFSRLSRLPPGPKYGPAKLSCCT